MYDVLVDTRHLKGQSDLLNGFLARYYGKGSFIQYVRKMFQKTNIPYPLIRMIRTRTCE